MNKIKVLDKTFRPYLSEKEIRDRVSQVAAQISTDLAGKNPIFVGILNGSFIFAADLFRDISIPAEISFVKVSSYEGTASTGNVSKLIGFNEDIKGRTVVIVEDIIDSGLSMQRILKELNDYQPAEVLIASLLVKPGNLQVQLKVDYCCFEIPNDFILGYGLDYNRYGRNLKDIYVIDEE